MSSYKRFKGSSPDTLRQAFEQLAASGDDLHVHYEVKMALQNPKANGTSQDWAWLINNGYLPENGVMWAWVPVGRTKVHGTWVERKKMLAAFLNFRVNGNFGPVEIKELFNLQDQTQRQKLNAYKRRLLRLVWDLRQEEKVKQYKLWEKTISAVVKNQIIDI